jgi:hypothetical protein
VTDSHVLPDPGTPFGETVRRRLRESVEGGGIAVFTGRVEVLDGHPLAHEVPEYVEKYGPRVESFGPGRDLATFLAKYTVVTRIRPEKVRGF